MKGFKSIVAGFILIVIGIIIIIPTIKIIATIAILAIGTWFIFRGAQTLHS